MSRQDNVAFVLHRPSIRGLSLLEELVEANILHAPAIFVSPILRWGARPTVFEKIMAANYTAPWIVQPPRTLDMKGNLPDLARA